MNKQSTNKNLISVVQESFKEIGRSVLIGALVIGSYTSKAAAQPVAGGSTATSQVITQGGAGSVVGTDTEYDFSYDNPFDNQIDPGFPDEEVESKKTSVFGSFYDNPCEKYGNYCGKTLKTSFKNNFRSGSATQQNKTHKNNQPESNPAPDYETLRQAELEREFQAYEKSGDFLNAAQIAIQLGWENEKERIYMEAVAKYINQNDVLAAVNVARIAGFTDMTIQKYNPKEFFNLVAQTAKNANLPEIAERIHLRLIGEYEQEENYRDAALVATSVGLIEEAIEIYQKNRVLLNSTLIPQVKDQASLDSIVIRQYIIELQQTSSGYQVEQEIYSDNNETVRYNTLEDRIYFRDKNGEVTKIEYGNGNELMFRNSEGNLQLSEFVTSLDSTNQKSSADDIEHFFQQPTLSTAKDLPKSFGCSGEQITKTINTKSAIYDPIIGIPPAWIQIYVRRR